MASSFLRSSNVVVIVVVVLVVVAAIVLMVCQEKWVSPVQRGRRSVETFVSNPCNNNANKPIVNVSYNGKWVFTVPSAVPNNATVTLTGIPAKQYDSTQIPEFVDTVIYKYNTNCDAEHNSFVGLPLKSTITESTKTPTENVVFYSDCTQTGNSYWMFPIITSKKSLIQSELAKLLSQSNTSPYATSTTNLRFYYGTTPGVCDTGEGSGDVVHSGPSPCSQYNTEASCVNHPQCQINLDSLKNIFANKCECKCSQFNEKPNVCEYSCDNCMYNYTTNTCSESTNFFDTTGSMSFTPFNVTLGNQGLSESPSTSLTTFTPSTSLTPTYPSYSPPSQQPQQMTTPAAARDYYNYGYSNGYSSGYYASLYSRYPYYGYSNRYNYGYSNNNSYYGYYGGYAQGSGTPVASQESL